VLENFRGFNNWVLARGTNVRDSVSLAGMLEVEKASTLQAETIQLWLPLRIFLHGATSMVRLRRC
jgi:hypothetical protein